MARHTTACDGCTYRIGSTQIPVVEISDVRPSGVKLIEVVTADPSFRGEVHCKGLPVGLAVVDI